MHARTRLVFVVTFFLLLGLARLALAQPSFQTNAEFNAVPTFHSLSVYWNPPGKSAARFAQVEYKPQGAPDSAYKRGLDLWYDQRTPAAGGGTQGEYRGSLVHLEPNTAYDLRLRLTDGENGPVVRTHLVPAQTACTWGASCTRTWSEDFIPPAGYTIRVPSTGVHTISITTDPTATAPTFEVVNGTMTIEVPGEQNSQGWVLVTSENPPTRSVVRGVSSSTNCIEVDGVSRVIIRGLRIENCTINAIHLDGGSRHVVIEDNDITGWGSTNPDDGNAAVFCQDPGVLLADKVHAVVVQKNLIHDPRHGSSPWGPQRIHPELGMAVRFKKCGTNHVIRYNDVFASPGHYFKDGFGGTANFGDEGNEDQGGFPWADSDIYGNRIQNVYDDAIETEGDVRNVRVWGNYIDQVFSVLANATVGVGPLYVWRNVSHSLGGMNQRPRCLDTDGTVLDRCPEGTPPAPPDREARGPFIKGGGQTLDYSGGRAYYFHNTILQPPAAHCGGTSLTCGAGWAINKVMAYQYNIVSHNNIWQIHKPERDDDDTTWEFAAVWLNTVQNCSLGNAANQNECRFSHDMYNNGRFVGATRTTPPDWSNVAPRYATSGIAYPSSGSIPSEENGWEGDFTLMDGEPGHGDALVLANFNDQYASPDIGAHQTGTCMKFGRAAATEGCTGSPGVIIPPRAVLNTTPASGSGDAPLPVTFDVSGSTQGTFPIARFRLQFGHDSQEITRDWVSTNFTQNHTYPAGAYTATLTLFDDQTPPNTSTVTRDITALCSAAARPTARLTANPTSGDSPLLVEFDASASTAVSPAQITSYSITYGDSASGSGITQSHTYTSTGQFIAVLTVTDSAGCVSDPVPVTITVGSCVKPTARLTATPTSGQKPLTVNFDGSASTAVSPATIVSHNISYGDGGSGTGPTQTHTYITAAQRIASLTVTDSNGCKSDPSDRLITITDEPTSSVTLQQGVNGYAGTTDAVIVSAFPDQNTGSHNVHQLKRETSRSLLIRFGSIFASQGGPVPDNATIISATLSMYKYWGPDAVFKASRLLRPFSESNATWNLATAGTPWGTPGAFNASDVSASPDGQGSIGDAAVDGCISAGAPEPQACWLHIDVTPGVQAFRSGTPNHGWKVAYVSGSDDSAGKEFRSSENTDYPALRPKLTITYTVPTGTTATLQQGVNGYASTTDAVIVSAFPDDNTGSQNVLQLKRETSRSLLIRFGSIFVSQGGPVPNNATITSATLSMYKFWGPDGVFKASRLLRPFSESNATWNLATAGTPWGTPGALNASDVSASPDGQGSIGDAAVDGCTGPGPHPQACWLHIDVTPGIQAFLSGTPNHGWKVAYVSGSNDSAGKEFNSSENTDWPALRPRLTITYTVP